MTLPPLLTKAPEQTRMSGRARAYLITAGIRGALLALLCLLGADLLASPTFEGITGGLPPAAAIHAWGAYFTLAAVIALVAATTGREGVARAALLLAMFGSGSWAAGLIFAANLSTGLSEFLAWLSCIALWSLTAKDASMLQQPLRNPFEPLTRQILKCHDPRG